MHFYSSVLYCMFESFSDIIIACTYNLVHSVVHKYIGTKEQNKWKRWRKRDTDVSASAFDNGANNNAEEYQAVEIEMRKKKKIEKLCWPFMAFMD